MSRSESGEKRVRSKQKQKTLQGMIVKIQTLSKDFVGVQSICTCNIYACMSWNFFIRWGYFVFVDIVRKEVVRRWDFLIFKFKVSLATDANENSFVSAECLSTTNCRNIYLITKNFLRLFCRLRLKDESYRGKNRLSLISRLRSNKI